MVGLLIVLALIAAVFIVFALISRLIWGSFVAVNNVIDRIFGRRRTK